MLPKGSMAKMSVSGTRHCNLCNCNPVLRSIWPPNQLTTFGQDIAPLAKQSIRKKRYFTSHRCSNLLLFPQYFTGLFPWWCWIMVKVFLPPQWYKVAHRVWGAFVPLAARTPGFHCSCEVDDLRTVSKPAETNLCHQSRSKNVGHLVEDTNKGELERCNVW